MFDMHDVFFKTNYRMIVLVLKVAQKDSKKNMNHSLYLKSVSI